MTRVTSFKCDACMELMTEEERSVVMLSTPEAKWAADFCSNCVDEVKKLGTFALKQRKKKPALAAAKAA